MALGGDNWEENRQEKKGRRKINKRKRRRGERQISGKKKERRKTNKREKEERRKINKRQIIKRDCPDGRQSLFASFFCVVFPYSIAALGQICGG